jgi:glycosyltransferase involved in cell wall biosynthesis
MKIAIDARESGTGTGRYIDKLIEHLHELNVSHEITILTKAPRLEYFKKVAPKFETQESNYSEFSFAEQIDLLRQIKRLKADLVHFGMTQQPILYKGKTVTTVHDLTTLRFRNPSKNFLVFSIKQGIYRWVIKIVAQKSAAIITPTEFVKDDLAKFVRINKNKTKVTYEAADIISQKPKPVQNVQGKKFIMYVGRPTPHKNLERLIDAFEILTKDHPDLYLVLSGKSDANYERIKRVVEGKKLTNLIIFTDFVSEGQLRWLYENATAYIFPSLSEGFGLPALEAMAHGAPVVSSNATCLPEVYGNAAHYFNPLDVNDMAEKIDEVLSNPKLQKELVEKGKNQVKKYSWKRMAEETLAVYEEVLGR